jgi:tRNA(Ile)-lysidine synthase
VDPVSNACDELFENDASAEGRFLIAFSGGMDSQVLLHAMAAAASRHGAQERLLAVHVDHGLDPESAGWAARCEAQAAALGIEFQSRKLDLAEGGNLEARARTARYQVFESLLGEADVLLLAHHAADQLESRLLHLLQGRGLYGMPVSRSLGAGQLMRPLLGLSRDALVGYARSHGLDWIEDPSNADTSLDRNYLRHELLPSISERFPGLPRRIGQVAEHLADLSAALDELAGLDRVPLPQSVFDGRSLPARVALLRRWLVLHAGAGGVSRAAIMEFLRQLDAANDRYPSLSLPDGKLVRYRRALHLIPPAPELHASYPLAVPGVLRLPHGELMLRAAAPEEAEQVVQLLPPLSVSFADQLSGARLHRGGHDRGVRELMRDAGVAPWLRDTQPLILDARGLALIAGVAARDAEPAAGTAEIGAIPVVVRWTPESRGTHDAR